MKRHGLMHPRGAARVVALLLAVGVVAGFSATYLVQAGMSGWGVLGLTVVVLAIPIVAVIRSSNRDR